MFLDHTQRRTTVGRTPLDEWSARRRDFYLITHDTHNRQISMPPVGFEPTISAGERPPGAWIFVCCECRVLSGRGLCNELITRPEESYRLCCVVVCDLETSRMGVRYIYDISSLRVNDLTLILLTWRKWWAPNNASKQHMGFNSGFKGLIRSSGIWSIPGDLCLFSYSIAISNSNALSSGISCSAVCISVCLTSLNPYAMNSWENWFLHLTTVL